MTYREWAIQAKASRAARAADADNARPLVDRWGGREFVSHFIFSMTFFGVIAFFAGSKFPLALGLFLFFTDDDFIEWVLRKVGIQFVPDTLGPEFVKAFIFLLGMWTLLVYWRDSAPPWLLQELPSHGSWWLIAGSALYLAAIKIISVAIVRRGLPMFDIEIAPKRQSLAALAVMSLLIGLTLLAGYIFTA